MNVATGNWQLATGDDKARGNRQAPLSATTLVEFAVNPSPVASRQLPVASPEGNCQLPVASPEGNS